MYDPGLKSYQDIVVPEYPEPEEKMDREDWIIARDEGLSQIFQHVLMIQRWLEIQIYFEWSPHVDSLRAYTFNDDGKWHSDRENKCITIVDMIFDPLTEEDNPEEWTSKVIHQLDKWADDFYERNN